MPIPTAFWAQEAKEKSHKSIKNALLAAGETPHGKHSQKKKKSTPKKSHKGAGKGKMKKVMEEFKNHTLKMGKSNKKITNRKQAVAVALSEARKSK